MKKKILLALLPILAYSEDINVEINYGSKASFGIDQEENLYNLLFPVLKLSLPLEFEEYMPVYDKKNDISSNLAGSDNKNNKIYIPKVSGDVIDGTLAARYLSQSIKFKNNLNVKIDFKKLGLSLNLDNDLGIFTEDYKLKKSKISLLANNKYFNGLINYNILGENERRSLTNLDSYENSGYKKLEYNFELDPISNFKVRPTLNVLGVDKNAKIIPSVKYSNKNSFVSLGLGFSVGNENESIKNQISKVKYVAPGYDKIEYFKKWSLKKGEINLEKKEDYLNEIPDFEKAEVSGYKGTARILGLYSGSLYGDNPITFITNSFLDHLEQNKKLAAINDVVKQLETKTLNNGDVIKIAHKIYLDSLKTNYVTEFNNLIKDVTTDVYEKIGINLNEEYSNYHITNQIPEIFKPILPGIDPNFYFLGINPNIFDPRWLYFKGLVPENASLGEKENVERNSVENDAITDKLPKKVISYKKNKEYHYVGPDFKRYIFDDNIEKYKIHNSVEIIDKLLNGNFFEKTKSFFDLFGLKDHDLNKNLKYFLQDPARNIHGLDMIRGMYFHSSEKNKNITELEKEINKITFDEKNLKTKYYPYFNLKSGYKNDILNLNFETNLAKYHKKENEEVKFEKLDNDLTLNTKLKYKSFIFSNSSNLSFSKNNFETKKDKLSYYDLNFMTNTLLGYNFNILKNWDMELSLSHIGQIGYIKPITIKIDGKEYEKEIAKRDKDGNPIGLDGKEIKVSETTEYNLVDKYAKEKANGISKRKIHPTMYLQKEKSKAQPYLYSNYNIINPKLKLRYKASDNVEFTNEVMIPFAIYKSTPSGVNLVLSSNVKYILGDKDFNIFTDFKPIKLKTKGNVSIGYRYKENFAINYDSYLDLSFIKFNLYGKNEKYNLNTEINPLIFNFNIKPKIILSLNDKVKKMNYVLEAVDKDKYIAQIGVSNVLSDNSKIKDNLMLNLKEIMSSDKRTDFERKAIEKLSTEKNIDDELFKNMKYKLTPFVNLNKNGENIKYKVSFDAIYGSNEKKESTFEKGEFKIDDKEFANLDNILSKISEGERYITKTNYWDLFSTAQNLYFLKFPRYAIDSLKEKSVELNYQDYSLKSNLNLNKKGFIFNSDLEFDLNKISYKEIFKETETKHINNEIFVIESDKWTLYSRLKKQFTEKIKVAAKDPKTGKVYKDKDGNDLYIDGFLKISDNRKENEENIKNHMKLRGYNGYEYDKIEKKDALLDAMVKENYEYKVAKEKFNTLVTEKIKLKTNLEFGYNYKINNNFSTKFLLNHKFNLNYLTSDSILYNDLKLFGSTNLNYNNIISPKIDLNFNFYKHFNIKFDTALPFMIDNKKNKKVGFDFGMNLNINW